MDSLEADKKELDGVVNPSIVLPPYVVEERRQVFMKSLLEKDSIASQSRFMRRMLEDYAYLFHALGQLDMHRGILAGLSGDGLVQAALLRFVRKSMEKKEAEASGLLVNPYEQQPPPCGENSPHPRLFNGYLGGQIQPKRHVLQEG